MNLAVIASASEAILLRFANDKRQIDFYREQRVATLCYGRESRKTYLHEVAWRASEQILLPKDCRAPLRSARNDKPRNDKYVVPACFWVFP